MERKVLCPKPYARLLNYKKKIDLFIRRADIFAIGSFPSSYKYN
jgi:hypothetical protein